METYIIHAEVTPQEDGQVSLSLQTPDDPLLTIDILSMIIKQQLGKATNQRTNMQKELDSSSALEIAPAGFLQVLKEEGV